MVEGDHNVPISLDSSKQTMPSRGLLRVDDLTCSIEFPTPLTLRVKGFWAIHQLLFFDFIIFAFATLSFVLTMSYVIGGAPFKHIDGWQSLLAQSGSYRPTGDDSSDKIRELFGVTTFTEAFDFHEHPVTRLAVNYLQRCLGAAYTWDNKPISATLFPKLDVNGSPAVLDLPVLPISSDPATDWLGKGATATDWFGKGAKAMIVKAFYNAASDIQVSSGCRSVIYPQQEARWRSFISEY